MTNNYKISEIDFYNPDIEQSIRNLLSDTFNCDIFTHDWWKWKYLDSPFGVAKGWSIVNEMGEIVSVRIIWQWQLSNKDSRIQAYQTIDTATHKESRGKGYFRILTNKVIDYVNGNLIFNFPNNNSAPINIKMGWTEDRNQPWLLYCNMFNYVGPTK